MDVSFTHKEDLGKNTVDAKRKGKRIMEKLKREG